MAMALTVRDILQMKEMEGVEILAGHGGLDRIVTSATVMDAPDGIPWIKGNEFMFTSMYPIHRESRENQVRYIEDLAGRNVAALGVKLKRYMQELPEELVNTANKWNFPIVAVPYDKAWIDYINPIMTAILNDRSYQLMRSEEIYRSFTNALMTADSSLDDIGQLLHLYVENPVFIVPNHAVLQVPGLATDPDGTLFQAVRQTAEADREIVHAEYGVFRVRVQQQSYVAAAFHLDMELAGYICIQEKNRPFHSGDLASLLHGRNAVTLKALQIRAEQEHKKRSRDLFVNRLLYETIEEEDLPSLHRQARELDIRLQERYMAAACKIDGPPPETISRIVEEIGKDRFLPKHALVGVDKKNQIALLVPGHETDSLEHFNNWLHNMFDRIGKKLGPFQWGAGVGRQHALTELRHGYFQAVEALHHGIEIAGYGHVQHYVDMGVYRLFAHPAMQEEIDKFVEEWLGPLLDYDRLHHANLIQTLGVFLESGGNYRETAKIMFLHHNTVRYRIQTISKLLNCNIQETKTRLHLQIALLLLPLQKRKRSIRAD
jgi:sugar diacid utilization regulator